jgi:predicted nucleic acid-binding protein
VPVPVYFLDSSAVVKRYSSETGTNWVRSLVDPATGNQIYLARITRVEVVSAITRKNRSGGLSAADASAAIARLRLHLTNEYATIDISSTVIDHAMVLAETHALRGYDAIQLAAALELRDDCLAIGIPVPTLISADADLNTAAISEGLATEDPNTHP